MEALTTKFSDDATQSTRLTARVAQIAARLRAMRRPVGPHYLKLMASGQLLNVIWPHLRASDRRFRGIEILDDRHGREFRRMDLRGADAVVNPIVLPNNTIPSGLLYGVRVLWGKHAPEEPVVRIRLARTGSFGVDTNTDALKIRNGCNVTHYQLTGCIAPERGRAVTDISGTARWIASIATDGVLAILRRHTDLVAHLEQGRAASMSRDSLIERLHLESGFADLGGGVSLVATPGVIWMDIRDGIDVIAA